MNDAQGSRLRTEATLPEIDLPDHAGSPILGAVGVLLGTVLSWTFGFWLATSNLDADPSKASDRPPIYILGFFVLFAHTTVALGGGLASSAFILLLFTLVVVSIGMLPKNRTLPAKTS